MIVQSILGPRGLAIVADVGFVLACVAFLWGAIKLAYQRTQGQAMPRNLFTKVLDIGVEAFNIVWGTINRAVKLDTGRGLFLPTQPTDGAPVLARAELEGRLAETERSRDALMRAIEESISQPPRHDGQRGSIDVRTLLAIVTGSLGMLCALAALAIYSQGCIPARRFVLDHTDGVPARVSCVPRTQRCSVTDAGLYLPVQCSDDHREWPAMPLRPDGTQRTCAAGEGCEVIDGGIARCIAADAGR